MDREVHKRVRRVRVGARGPRMAVAHICRALLALTIPFRCLECMGLTMIARSFKEIYIWIPSNLSGNKLDGVSLLHLPNIFNCSVLQPSDLSDKERTSTSRSDLNDRQVHKHARLLDRVIQKSIIAFAKLFGPHQNRHGFMSARLARVSGARLARRFKRPKIPQTYSIVRMASQEPIMLQTKEPTYLASNLKIWPSNIHKRLHQVPHSTMGLIAI